MRIGFVFIFLTVLEASSCEAWMNRCLGIGIGIRSIILNFGEKRNAGRVTALSEDYLENDLVAVQKPSNSDGSLSSLPRLCVVRSDNTVLPLCRHEDDVETDLYVDPRCESDPFWSSNEINDEHIKGRYGEGWYGQRPVPSLGGGPGYGADAQEIWSISEHLIDLLRQDGIDLPVLDVGIAHGEKARGGSF